MGAIEKTVDAVAAKVGGACQLVVICGRNKRLIARLRAKCVPMWFSCGGSNGPHVPNPLQQVVVRHGVSVQGFADTRSAIWCSPSDT